VHTAARKTDYQLPVVGRFRENIFARSSARDNQVAIAEFGPPCRTVAADPRWTITSSKFTAKCCTSHFGNLVTSIRLT
jgi:hypothetical protein